MSLTKEDVEKIAYLARLRIPAERVPEFAAQLSGILDFVAQMNAADTSAVEPMGHPLDLSLRLRQDAISETDQRELFQSVAPLVAAGLYLVPKVIE